MFATLLLIAVVAVAAVFVYRKHKAKIDPTLDKVEAKFNEVKDKVKNNIDQGS